jgi:putative metalloprotease
MKLINKTLIPLLLIGTTATLCADSSFWDKVTDFLPTDKIEEVAENLSDKIDIDKQEKKFVDKIDDALPDFIADSVSSAVKSASDLSRAALITDEELYKEDAKDIAKWDENQTVAKDIDQYYLDLQKIMKKIPLPTDLKVKLDTKVYMNPFLYIFSKSNGAIRVNSGIIELLDDDQILFLMAHEIAHIANKDHISSYRKAHGMYALENAVNISGKTVGSAANGVLESVTSSMRKSEFQKSEEFEADEFAIKVLKKYGINKKIAVDTLEKLQYLNAPLLKMHPTAHERIQHIEDDL